MRRAWPGLTALDVHRARYREQETDIVASLTLVEVSF